MNEYDMRAMVPTTPPLSLLVGWFPIVWHRPVHRILSINHSTFSLPHSSQRLNNEDFFLFCNLRPVRLAGGLMADAGSSREKKYRWLLVADD
jgi:hypothetical protein